LGVGHGANYPTPENFAVTKPRRRPKRIQGCSASKEEVEEEDDDEEEDLQSNNHET
jgi:hypothetical protein